MQLWLGVLSGPLQTALNTINSPTIRSTVCDCLSNVGQNVFVVLPVSHRVVTLHSVAKDDTDLALCRERKCAEDCSK